MNITSEGFTCFRDVVDEEKDLLDRALKDQNGVKHIPLAVATQIVNGINYAYFCITKGISTGNGHYNNLIIIHKPISGDIFVKEVRKVKIV